MDWDVVFPKDLKESKAMTENLAATYLDIAKETMKERGASYDKEQERSMNKIVHIFNTLTGHHITEAQGWTFMMILKLVRANQGQYKDDNYIDLIAYASLLAECEHEENRNDVSE